MRCEVLAVSTGYKKVGLVIATVRMRGQDADGTFRTVVGELPVQSGQEVVPGGIAYLVVKLVSEAGRVVAKLSLRRDNEGVSCGAWQ